MTELSLRFAQTGQLDDGKLYKRPYPKWKNPGFLTCSRKDHRLKEVPQTKRPTPTPTSYPL